MTNRRLPRRALRGALLAGLAGGLAGCMTQPLFAPPSPGPDVHAGAPASAPWAADPDRPSTGPGAGGDLHPPPGGGGLARAPGHGDAGDPGMGSGGPVSTGSPDGDPSPLPSWTWEGLWEDEDILDLPDGRLGHEGLPGPRSSPEGTAAEGPGPVDPFGDRPEGWAPRSPLAGPSAQGPAPAGVPPPPAWDERLDRRVRIDEHGRVLDPAGAPATDPPEPSDACDPPRSPTPAKAPGAAAARTPPPFSGAPASSRPPSSARVHETPPGPREPGLGQTGPGPDVGRTPSDWLDDVPPTAPIPSPLAREGAPAKASPERSSPEPKSPEATSPEPTRSAPTGPGPGAAAPDPWTPLAGAPPRAPPGGAPAGASTPPAGPPPVSPRPAPQGPSAEAPARAEAPPRAAVEPHDIWEPAETVEPRPVPPVPPGAPAPPAVADPAPRAPWEPEQDPGSADHATPVREEPDPEEPLFDPVDAATADGEPPSGSMEFTAPDAEAHARRLLASPGDPAIPGYPPSILVRADAEVALQPGFRPVVVIFHDDGSRASDLQAAEFLPVLVRYAGRVDVVTVDVANADAWTPAERKLVRTYYMAVVPATVVADAERRPRLLKFQRTPAAVLEAVLEEVTRR